jgi:prevent-host-death family protein
MRSIQLKDAKAKLSAVVDRATWGKPSVITRHGKPEAAVLGFADWERLSRVPSFGRLLMSVPLGHVPQKWEPVLRKRTCPNKKIGRDDRSKKSHPARPGDLPGRSRSPMRDAGL